MAGKKGKQASRAVREARAARGGGVVAKKDTRWGMIMAIAAVLVFAVGVIGWPVYEYQKKQDQQRALAVWKPGEDNRDPSTGIAGVQVKDYIPQRHVTPDQRVAYDQSPPFGGPHDGVWAACTGVVYDRPVRNENMVHSLEHGTVWIAYNPDRVSGENLDVLVKKVRGQEYMMLSPYPTLDVPLSLQSWGHQLKLDDVNDERIDQFITALRVNRYQHPEPDGRCDALPGGFDIDNPPPLVTEAPGPDAVPMDGGVDASQAPGGMNQTPTVPTSAPEEPPVPSVPAQGGNGPSPNPRPADKQPVTKPPTTKAPQPQAPQPEQPVQQQEPPPPTTQDRPGLPLPLG